MVKQTPAILQSLLFLLLRLLKATGSQWFDFLLCSKKGSTLNLVASHPSCALY